MLELAYLIVYFGTKISIYTLTHTDIQTNQGNFLPTSPNEYWQHLALYPWTLYALLGVVLAWARSQRKNDAITWGNSLEPLVKKYFSPNFVICVDYLYRTAFIWILIMTFSIGIIQCVHIFALLLHINLTIGFTFSNFLIAIFILNIIYAQRTYRFLRYLISKNVTLGISLFLLTVALVFFLLTLNVIANAIISFFTLSQYMPPIPSWLQYLYSNHYDVIIFSWAWQLSMAAMMGFCFARIANGLSLRMLLLMLLTLPFLGQVFFLTMHFSHLLNTHNVENYCHIVLNANFLPIAALLLFIIFFVPMSGLSSFLRLSLEPDLFEKRQAPTNLFRGFIYVITLLVLTSLMGLLNLMLVLSALLAVPYVVITLMSIISFLIDIWKKRKSNA